MEAWGWRIPFLVAGPLGAIAFYFRMKIEESPQFRATLDAPEETAKSAAAADEDTSNGPVHLVRVYGRQILPAMVLVAAANTVGYALAS